MKKSLIGYTVPMLALLASAPALQAQSANASVEASATIEAFLNVEAEADLGFGSILPAAGATVVPGAPAGAGQTVGRLLIQHNAAVAVSASVPTGLSLSGAPDLPVSFSCGFSALPTGALDGAATSCGAIPNRSANGDGTARVSYLQVGGSILAADTEDRAPGTYVGTLLFTVTAVY